MVRTVTQHLFLMAALLAAGLAGSARADVIHMKGGQRIEGKIVDSDASSVIVETKFGRMTFERARIDRIEYQRLPKEELAHRRKAAGEDPQKLWEVARFALENDLKAEYREILEEVVRHDSQHSEANKALGRTYFDGEWFTPEGLKKYKDEIAEQKKAAGLVMHEGKWVKESTAKRLSGLEEYKGQWLSWKEIYTLQATEKMPELLGTTLEIRESDHYALRSELDEESQKEVLEVLEASWDHFNAMFQPTEKEQYIMGFYPVAVYVMPDPNLVTKFVEEGGYMKQLYNPPKGINERYLDASSFPVFFPRPLIVTSQGRHLKGGGSRLTSLIGFLTHYNGNLMIRRMRRGGAMPGWVEAGISHYYEGMMNGYRTLSITEYVGYEHVEKWDMNLQTFPQWYKKMTDPAFRQSLPKLAEIRPKIVEELDARDLVKGYFMVSWLLETHREEFVNYVRLAFSEKFALRVRVKEADAFQEAFKNSVEELEAEFEAWAAANPPHPPS